MTRTASILACALILLCGLLQAGCHLASMKESFDKEEGKEVLAKAKFDRVLIDSTGELQVYASMNRSTALKNEDAILRFADPYKELYLLVFKEDAGDFKTVMEDNDDLHGQYRKDTGAALAIYSNLTNQYTVKSMKSGKDSLLSARLLHGMEYRGYAITGVSGKISLFYMKGVYKSARNYYQVVTWTLASRRNLYEGIMQKMVESLQEGNNTTPQSHSL